MTFCLGTLCVAWYLLAVLGTEGNIGAFSNYTTRHFGGMNGVLVHAGESWRLLTANFVHHDILHLGFNLYAYALAGRLVEELFGSARALFSYVVTGVLSLSLIHI